MQGDAFGPGSGLRLSHGPTNRRTAKAPGRFSRARGPSVALGAVQSHSGFVSRTRGRTVALGVRQSQIGTRMRRFVPHSPHTGTYPLGAAQSRSGFVSRARGRTFALGVRHSRSGPYSRARGLALRNVSRQLVGPRLNACALTIPIANTVFD